MKYFLASVFLFLQFYASGHCQTPGPARPGIPGVVPVREQHCQAAKGSATERRYTNAELRFEITLPNGWQFAGNEFEEQMRSQGFDLGLKAPESIGRASRIQIDRALERVRVLFTAHRSMAGLGESPILRVSAEDLSLNPAVRDAVDYFDLMRSQFAAMRLPPDLSYSETQAEQLGKKQFAFLDISTSSGKKRIYARVRNGLALLFTLTYSKNDDLAALRQMLAAGEFELP